MVGEDDIRKGAARGGMWFPWARALLALLILGGFGARIAEAQAPETRVLYETGFEEEEGFDPDLTLIGQDGWVGDGTGGNGLVEGFFPGAGQHAYIGFNAPTDSEEFLNIWRPINYQPGPTNPPRVRFTVLMSIEDSTVSTNRDDFRWSVYNAGGTNAVRLFTLDFDNNSLSINYLLQGDDAEFTSTGRNFRNSTTYALEIFMDFEANLWSSLLDGTMLTTNLPITRLNSPLTFGDVDAVWAIRTPGKPGDNYMVFDNYRVVAESGTPQAPSRLEPLGLLRPGEFLVRAHGTAQKQYVLEATPALGAGTWTPLRTNTMPEDGFFDYLDRQATGTQRYYRLVER